MSGSPRRARVRALAKVNLSLKVLGRRADGYHELRTVFQTISLADALEFEFTPGRRTSLTVRSRPEIPDNLVERSARLVLEATRTTGCLDIRLAKRIPMGAGLGGGSSDAAAVLLALPVLAGKRLGLEQLIETAAALGSDVPYFLLGGRALGLGRGAELYPLPDERSAQALVVAPDVHVSTAGAYRSLGRELTSEPPQNIINSFQSWVWGQTGRAADRAAPAVGQNDFEAAVFASHPQLKSLKRQLETQGARSVLLSGSGSALFGVFPQRAEAERAGRSFRNERVFTVSFVSRARYHSLWRRWLEPHIAGRRWPPQSRYAQ